VRGLLSGAWELDPQVALRPEPFGALAYHYGNRRLTFLRSADLVALVQSLGTHASVEDALAASAIDSTRWGSFERALESLAESEVIRPR
jgi:putative mycofactocin binding protein MftB